MLLVMMRFLQHHILNLHQTDLCASLIFIKFHGNILDIFLQFGDHNVLERIDTPACLFNLSSHKLARLFHLRETQKIRQHV